MSTDFKTFTDTFKDDMVVSMYDGKLHIKTCQDFGHVDPAETNMAFSREVAKQLRDHLIELFPFPTQTGEVLVESVGEMTSISTSGGSIVINATGNVIINQK